MVADHCCGKDNTASIEKIAVLIAKLITIKRKQMAGKIKDYYYVI